MGTLEVCLAGFEVSQDSALAELLGVNLLKAANVSEKQT